MNAERTAAVQTLEPGRLERRKALTRSAILEAADGLFHANGYEATSIQQIAERADTGVGTVYGYFASKEEVLREVLRARSAESLERYFATVDESTPYVDRICTAMAILADYMRENRRVLVAAFQLAPSELDEERSSMVLAAFTSLIARGVEHRQIAPIPADIAARTLVTAVTLAALGIGIWAGREDDEAVFRDLETIARQMLSKPA